jgi:hypothetical protein
MRKGCRTVQCLSRDRCMKPFTPASTALPRASGPPDRIRCTDHGRPAGTRSPGWCTARRGTTCDDVHTNPALTRVANEMLPPPVRSPSSVPPSCPAEPIMQRPPPRGSPVVDQPGADRILPDAMPCNVKNRSRDALTGTGGTLSPPRRRHRVRSPAVPPNRDSRPRPLAAGRRLAQTPFASCTPQCPAP